MFAGLYHSGYTGYHTGYHTGHQWREKTGAKGILCRHVFVGLNSQCFLRISLKGCFLFFNVNHDLVWKLKPKVFPLVLTSLEGEFWLNKLHCEQIVIWVLNVVSLTFKKIEFLNWTENIASCVIVTPLQDYKFLNKGWIKVSWGALWLSITRPSLTRTKVDFPWISFIAELHARSPIAKEMW